MLVFCAEQSLTLGMLTFRTLSLLTAALTGTLSLLLVFVPDFVFLLFSVESHETAQMLARRAGMLFLGLACIAFFARNAVLSAERQAICLGFSVLMFGLAVVSCFEFARGYAGFGILLALITEVIFAYFFACIWFANKD